MPAKEIKLPSIRAYGKVDNAFDWYNSGRPQILAMLARNEYGHIPPLLSMNLFLRNLG